MLIKGDKDAMIGKIQHHLIILTETIITNPTWKGNKLKYQKSSFLKIPLFLLKKNTIIFLIPKHRIKSFLKHFFYKIILLISK